MFPDSGIVPFADDSSTPEIKLMRRVYALYAAMAATIPLDAKSGLGGKLFFGGEMHPAREMLIAANIAGAASVAASADPAAVRQAMRDGVVDFVVTSLEEALRILKNEIRKKLPVAVGVSVSPQTLMEQMLERGVLPDLLPAGDSLGGVAIDAAHVDVFLGQGALAMLEPSASDGQFVTWSVDSEWMRWLPRLDAFAKAVIPAEDAARQRWLMLAPRYVGRLAQRQHAVIMSPSECREFTTAVNKLIEHESPNGLKAMISSCGD